MAEVGFVPMEKELGTRLLVLRGDRSQEEVAAGVGVRRETIKQWENTERHIKAVDLVKLATYYDVSVDYLLGLSDRKALDADTQTVQYTLGVSSETVANMLKASSAPINAGRGMDALLSHKNMPKLMRTINEMLSKVDRLKKEAVAKQNLPPSFRKHSEEIIFGKLYSAVRAFENIMENIIKTELDKAIPKEQEADNAEEK